MLKTYLSYLNSFVMIRINGAFNHFARNSFFLLSVFVSLNVHIGYAQTTGSDSSGTKIIETHIIMDDGIALSTRIFLPKEEGSFPAVLVRSPYNKDNGVDKRFLARNIAIVMQDVRGMFGSQGIFYPFVNERTDGLATLRWIRSQPWSNGKVGGWGGSYVGYTQWIIADSLDAAAPLFSSSDMYELMYPGGLFSLKTAFGWGFAVSGRRVKGLTPENINQRMNELPLSTATEPVEFLSDWLRHEKPDAFWAHQNYHGPIKNPVISVAGWYDIFLKSQLKNFQELSSDGNTQDRFIIGPWAHGSPGYKNDYGGGIDKKDIGKAKFEFMVKALHGEVFNMPSPFQEKKYNLFIMERNEYVASDVWPPRETKEVAYYLQPNQSLTTQIPVKKNTFSYVYDPLDPFPNYGGTFLGDSVGGVLQNKNLHRKDQVSFDTEVFKKPLILLGPLSASLWLSGSAACTDFVVSLQDVFPNGKIINIQEGGTRINFTDHQPAEHQISVWATGYQLNPGHRLRVVISSSLFPRFNRGINSCEPIYSAKDIQKATQQIFAGEKTPSRIILPVYSISK